MNRFRPTSCALQTPGSGCKQGLDLVAFPVHMLLGGWTLAICGTSTNRRGKDRGARVHSELVDPLHSFSAHIDSTSSICVLQFACYPPKNQRTQPWSACLEHRLEKLLCRACTGFALSIVWHPSPSFLNGFSYLLHAS